ASWAQDPPKSYNIPAQDLGSALREFARQSNREILFSSDAVKDKTTQGVSNATSADAALAQLLVGTGLVVSTSSSGQILVSKAGAKGASAATDPQNAPNGAPNEQSQSQSNRVAPSPTPAVLEEIVVTAQKREERLLDVPVPVTAISATALLDSNMLRIQD